MAREEVKKSRGCRCDLFGSSRPWARPWTALACPTPVFPAASPGMAACGKLKAARRAFVAVMKRLAVMKRKKGAATKG